MDRLRAMRVFVAGFDAGGEYIQPDTSGVELRLTQESFSHDETISSSRPNRGTRRSAAQSFYRGCRLRKITAGGGNHESHVDHPDGGCERRMHPRVGNRSGQVAWAEPRLCGR